MYLPCQSKQTEKSRNLRTNHYGRNRKIIFIDESIENVVIFNYYRLPLIKLVPDMLVNNNYPEDLFQITEKSFFILNSPPLFWGLFIF